MATQKLSIAAPAETGGLPVEKPARKVVSRSKKVAVAEKAEEIAAPQPVKLPAKKAPKKAVKKTAPAKKAGTTVPAKKQSSKKKQSPGKTRSVTPAPKKITSSESRKTHPRRIIFQLRFHTEFGQSVFISGDHPLLGSNDPELAVPLQYFNEDYWYLVMEADELIEVPVTYHYIVRNTDGTLSFDWGNDKTIRLSQAGAEELVLIDSWNYAGYFENTFYTEPFTEVLLPRHAPVSGPVQPARATHTLKVKAPLLSATQCICLLGSAPSLGNWSVERPMLLSREAGDAFYRISLDLSGESFPIAYKYGVYDIETKQFVRFEDGNNRVLYDNGKPGRHTIVNDGFAVLPNNTWKGAGIAIPVFSLRSENSFGVGEFSDLNLLADWAKKTGLKMIQLLPVNDTTATHTWSDSYPYAAISAFALHPMYLNLEKISSGAARKRLQGLEKERLRLNALPAVDYEAVNKIKWEHIRAVFSETSAEIFESEAYKTYFDRNRHWLIPYAAFCCLRDKYGTVDFSQWPAHRSFESASAAGDDEVFAEASLHYFVQFHLHLQLREAAAYAHKSGVILKGDIAIGVYRHGADVWQNPDLFHMSWQAGAPPDDFAVKGQNWGFPTYNWQRMREDGFAWWKQRFAQMSDYFDAFRIDHILGFFRIWSIPMDAVEGILGHFVPAIPVHVNEFHSRQVWFDHERYTQPYITDGVLWELFGADHELVKKLFLQYDGFGNYRLLPEYRTQRQIEAHFATLEQDEHHVRIMQGLFDLVSNVILFDAEQGDGLHFHFRFGMENTSSFRNLDAGTREKLHDLYINYFFRRQDDFWKKEALQKLPALKRVTNMLVCGEDLGMVPSCVPDVMQQLGLLSLEIQRMPKDPEKEFFHPADAPYLSVVTPSTHDMSTIRGWWEEDRQRTQQFYNNELGQAGEAPVYCEPWINKAIVIQHLYAPSIWTVFQLQDLLGMDEKLRRENPAEERINVPANPKHYWQYRMHLSLEELMAADAFNEELSGYVSVSGRA